MMGPMKLFSYSRIRKPSVLSLLIIFTLWLNAGGQTPPDPSRLPLSRENFLKELLRPQSDRNTLFYDANTAGSYRLTKLDAAHSLPDAAKAAKIDLLAFLAMGPKDAPINYYYICTFVREQDQIRVVQVTFAQSRFSYKSTGLMTSTQFQSFVDAMAKTNVFNKGVPDDQETAAANETKYDLLLARWSKGKSDLYYGSQTFPRQNANLSEFRQKVGELMRSLTKTFPFMPSSAPPPTPTPQPSKPPPF